MVNFDPDIEAQLLREVRERNLEFDRVVNEALRLGLASVPKDRSRFVQKTYSLGAMNLDRTKPSALADMLEEAEIIKRIHLAEGR